MKWVSCQRLLDTNQSHMVFDTFPRITYNIHRNQTIIIESDGIIYVDCRRMEGL